MLRNKAFKISRPHARIEVCVLKLEVCTLNAMDKPSRRNSFSNLTGQKIIRYESYRMIHTPM